MLVRTNRRTFASSAAIARLALPVVSMAMAFLFRVPGADRRIKMLSLTAKGTQLREEISQAVAEHDLVMRRLDDAQHKALRPILEALLTEVRWPASSTSRAH